MHILFVHQNYPGQFGHLANYLATHLGHRCTFVTSCPPKNPPGPVELIPFVEVDGPKPTQNFLSRGFEHYAWMLQGIQQALARRPSLRPDVVVGHSGLGSVSLLGDLYDAPTIGYFEFFYRSGPYADGYRSGEHLPLPVLLRSQMRNAAQLLDLHTCGLPPIYVPAFVRESGLSGPLPFRSGEGC